MPLFCGDLVGEECEDFQRQDQRGGGFVFLASLWASVDKSFEGVPLFMRNWINICLLRSVKRGGLGGHFYPP